MIHYTDPWLTIHGGDAREVLTTLPDGSVHCVVTSPPYWGLRDYGTATWIGGSEDCDHKVGRFEYETPISDKQRSNNGSAGHQARGECPRCGAQRQDSQLGLEATPEEYVANLVGVFREVRRVLRDDGTLWLNLGSSYASGGIGSNQSRQPESARAYDTDDRAPSGSSAPGSSYSGLCDGCLGGYLNHLRRTLGIAQPLALDGQPRPSSGRGNEHRDSERAFPDASPPDVLESTSLRSWRQRRGPCSRCDSRASSLSGLGSSADDAPGFSRSSWLNYTRSLKPKDLVPIPWMVAMALQQDGWYLRRDVIWSKPNPMPESVTDRPTSSHEYLFLLAKRERYYFDQEAVREAAGEWSSAQGFNATGQARRGEAVGHRNGKGEHPEQIQSGRNLRSVWTIATRPYPGAHFAVFPPELPERCIKAGCPENGVVLDPFAGSGTVGMVANRLSRRAILVDLNPEYLTQQMKRNAQVPLGV